jgi:hypothetical protein
LSFFVTTNLDINRNKMMSFCCNPRSNVTFCKFKTACYKVSVVMIVLSAFLLLRWLYFFQTFYALTNSSWAATTSAQRNSTLNSSDATIIATKPIIPSSQMMISKNTTPSGTQGMFLMNESGRSDTPKTTTTTTPQQQQQQQKLLLQVLPRRHRHSPLSPAVCQRPCYDYRNKILLKLPSPAGLSDRLYVFHYMLQLAGYLCAQLYVPRPKFLLDHRRHNQNVRLDPNVTWNEFVVFSYKKNQLPSSLLEDEQEIPQDMLSSLWFVNQTMTKNTSITGASKAKAFAHNNTTDALVDWTDNLVWYNRQPSMEMFRDNKERYRHWLFVTSRRPETVWSDFEQVEQHSFAITQQQQQQELRSITERDHDERNDTGFIWEMAAPFYSSADIVSKRIEHRLRGRRRRQGHHPPSLAALFMMKPIVHHHNNSNINDTNNNHHQDDANNASVTADNDADILEWWRRMQPNLSPAELIPFYKAISTVMANESHANDTFVTTSAGCSYVNLHTPKAIQVLREQVFDTIRNRLVGRHNSSSSGAHSTTNASNTSSLAFVASDALIIGHFHIRRNDAIQECDTSLEKLKSYLNCSLPEALSFLSSKEQNEHRSSLVVVLVSTDEQDDQYRRDVLQLIEDVQPQQPPSQQGRTINSSIRIIAMDLDGMVHSLIQEAVAVGTMPARSDNQFYIFQCEQAVRKDPRIQFLLFQRRSSCPACTNVTHQLMLPSS